MQYKRKAEYLPAVLVFVACVSLVSVGFSSWNYWENVSDEATIDVTVSSVEDLTGVSITNTTTDIAIGTYFYQDIKNKTHLETANIDYLIKITPGELPSSFKKETSGTYSFSFSSKFCMLSGTTELDVLEGVTAKSSDSSSLSIGNITYDSLYSSVLTKLSFSVSSSVETQVTLSYKLPQTLISKVIAKNLSSSLSVKLVMTGEA